MGMTSGVDPLCKPENAAAAETVHLPLVKSAATPLKRGENDPVGAMPEALRLKAATELNPLIEKLLQSARPCPKRAAKSPRTSLPPRLPYNAALNVPGENLRTV